MQTHKPLRGWRALLGEVGIIVVGVLLALGAQEVVQALHADRQAQEALRAIEQELARSAGVFEERVMVQPCLDRRLNELGAIIATARRTHRIPAIGKIGAPPLRPMESSAWSMAEAQGIVADLPDTQRDHFSLVYTVGGAGYYKDRVIEQDMWTTLEVLEDAPGPIDETLLAQVTVTLKRLGFRSWLDGINASDMLGDMRATGIASDYFMIADEGETIDKAGMKAKVERLPICQPLRVSASKS